MSQFLVCNLRRASSIRFCVSAANPMRSRSPFFLAYFGEDIGRRIQLQRKPRRGLFYLLLGNLRNVVIGDGGRS